MEKSFHKGIGIDLVEVSRFAPMARDRKHPFLKKVFTAAEIAHCFKYKQPASHIAGMFAAKEAASKALGTDRFPFAELEIRHDKKGALQIWRKGKRIAVSVSISHTADYAVAIAAC